MNLKYATEKFLAESGLNYTTLRLCGFMQVGILHLRLSNHGWITFSVCSSCWVKIHDLTAPKSKHG